jgi:hypothetical protein
VLLAGEENEIAPARLIVIGPYGAVRSVGLDRILAGTHYERTNPLPPGTTDVPGLAAQWLGNGLFAVSGEDERTSASADSYTPLGLRIVDTRDWSVRTLDTQASGATVADGVLLATGGSSRENLDTGSIVRHPEGLAAYGPDGSLRWRLWPHEDPFVETVYRSRALVLKPGSGIRGPSNVLIDLRTGRVIGREASLPTKLPLVGKGSGFGC